MYLDNKQVTAFKDVDINNSFFHFTEISNIEPIFSNGILPMIGDNAKDAEATEKVFFSQGADGILQAWDVWLKWVMNKTYSKNDWYNIYDGMSDYEKSIFYREWDLEFRSGNYYNDENKKSFVFDKMYSYMKDRAYFVLDLEIGKDFSYDDFDENKIDVYKKLNNGNSISYIYAKEFYGPYSDVDNMKMEKWNLHTFSNVGVDKSKIKLLTDENGNYDLLSVVCEVYNKYNNKNYDYPLLDDFIRFVKLKEMNNEYTDSCNPGIKR